MTVFAGFFNISDVICQKQLAKKIGVSPKTIREWVRLGKIPSPIVVSSSLKLWSIDSIDRWLLGETSGHTGRTVAAFAMIRCSQAGIICSKENSMPKVSLIHRLLARMVARKHYINYLNDRNRFEQEVANDEVIAGIDPATLILLIKLMLMFFDWWMTRKITVPSVVAQADEPGRLHEDDDIDLGAILDD